MKSDRPLVKASLCQNCHAYPHQCFCQELPQVESLSNINFIVHHRESHLSSNTAWPGHLVLKNSSFVQRGLPDRPLREEDFCLQGNSYVLFPSEHATAVDEQVAQKILAKGKFELFVPDGTWQQAQRMVKREKLLHGLPHLIVNTKRISKYQLRKQPSEGRLCTLEAVIELLKFFEDAKVVNSLEWVLERHIVTNLQRRGLINKSEFNSRIEQANKLLASLD